MPRAHDNGALMHTAEVLSAVCGGRSVGPEFARRRITGGHHTKRQHEDRGAEPCMNERQGQGIDKPESDTLGD